MKAELRMHMQLLVAFNGRQRVLEELASIEGVDMASLEREIDQLRGSASAKPKNATTRKTRRRRTALELTNDAALRDDIRAIVEHLALAYERKEFLPDLWRVRQFLDSHDIPASKVKSRGDALPKVVSALSGMSTGELEALAAESKDNRGDLSVLTDHILGPVEGKHPASTRAGMRPVGVAERQASTR